MSSHVTQPGAPESPHQNGERGSESRRQSQNHPYKSVFADFITGHPSCTVCFWETFHKMYPDSPYEYVTFCHTCRRFDLYETEAEMKADDPKWW
ncbi:Uncharacterised protein [Shigella boydii]|nr:Uncharacterised protein [Shigella boydii]